MSSQVLAEVVRNVGVLLALALLFDVVAVRTPLRARSYRSALTGAMVGGLGMALMATPYQLEAGLVFDARSVLLALSGLFFGPVATLIAVFVTAAYRIYLGGVGAVMGVSVIVASGAIGLAWRKWRGGRLEELGAGELYLLGLVVHIVMLGLAFTLPAGLPGQVLRTVGPVVMVVFPAATAALGIFMVSRLKREGLASQLQASEARYRSLFENNHAAMLVIDPTNGRIVDANPAAVRFYGWPREQLKARSISDINVLSNKEVRTEMRRAREGERTFFRFRHRLASGEIRDVEVMSGKVTVDGEPLLYSIIHDVTREREALEALRLRSAALEAAANAIMITDRDGIIEWVNSAFCDLYGYSQHEVVGKKPKELVRSGVQDALFYEELWRTLESGEPWSGRLINRRKDGSHLEEEMTITPVRDAEGEIAHFVAVKQDLTQWRAMEQRLALARKLESVGQLAGGVAHDFNNLLTVINGTLDLVLSETPEDHERRADLEEVRSAGERGAGLTRQLLAFGKRQVLRKESIDLNTLIVDMTRMLRRLIGEGITIITELDEDAVPVRADRGQLEQVIVNLAVNARDAMPVGGSLTLATDSVRLSAAGEPEATNSPQATHLRLTVRDTGTGIEPEARSRIFDPFFTTKADSGGTGLGLATVYGIVTQSDGDIRVDSEPGEGTTFEVLLPGTSTPVEPTEPRTRRDAATGSETVLVVEDEGPIRRLVGRVLGRAGYTVLEAGNGPEALDLLREHGDDVALLFTDVVMPGMSGPELVQGARDLQPGLKVLFASGYAGDTLAQHGLTPDEEQFLEKPYTIQSLTETVRDVLDM